MSADQRPVDGGPVGLHAPASHLTAAASNQLDDDMSSVVSGGSGDGDCGSAGQKLTFKTHQDVIDEDGKPKTKQKKLSRNESEKWRRDRLNAYIGELAKIVPLTMTSNKKMDKASILRLTVAYLRIYHDIVRNAKTDSKWRPDILTQESLGQTIMDSVGGFMLVVNKRGLLIFATDSIEELLGHDLVSILGLPVANIVHPEDHDILARQFTDNPDNDSQRPPIRAASSDSEFDTPVTGHRKFCIKMLNAKDKQAGRYETVECVGHIKTTPGITPLGAPPGMHQPSEPEVHLIAIGKLVVCQPSMEMAPILNSAENQWITRHEMDGKITFSDPRGAWWTGFMPGESIGLSAYALLHPDDIGAVVSLHNSFLTAGQIPSCTFRMFTKSRDQLYIQTSTHMVIDMWTKKPRFIISINDVLSEEVGQRALQRQADLLARQTERLALTEAEEPEGDQAQSDRSDTPTTSSSPARPSSNSNCSSPQSFSTTNSPMIRPDLEVEDQVVKGVKVGGKKYVIELNRKDDFSPGSSISAYDPHATYDSDNSVPLVTPIFLGDDEANREEEEMCISPKEPTLTSQDSHSQPPKTVVHDKASVGREEGTSPQQKIHIVGHTSDQRKNSPHQAASVRTTRVHLVTPTHTAVLPPTTSPEVVPSPASRRVPNRSSSLLLGLLRDHPKTAMVTDPVTEVDRRSEGSYQPSHTSSQDSDEISPSEVNDINSVESLPIRCESPVLATVRDELTKQLLDHQGKLETSLREQQQELKLLKHQLGASSSSDSTNPKLQALEEKCQRHGEDLQALKVKLEYLNHLSQISNGAPPDGKEEEQTGSPGISSMSGGISSMSGGVSSMSGSPSVNEHRDSPGGIQDPGRVPAPGGNQGRGGGTPGQSPTLAETQDQGGGQTVASSSPGPSSTADRRGSQSEDTHESLTTTLATLQSLAATQDSSLLQTDEVKNLVRSLVMVLSQARHSETSLGGTTANTATRSTAGPTSPKHSTAPHSTPTPSSSQGRNKTKLEALLLGKQHSNPDTISSLMQASSAPTSAPRVNGLNGSVPYSKTKNGTHLPKTGRKGIVQTRKELSSNSVTSSTSMPSQSEISAPGGSRDKPHNHHSPSADGSRSFDMLRKILTEYKEKQSNAAVVVNETVSSAGKERTNIDVTEHVTDNNGFHGNMQINVDHLLSQLVDELDLSVLDAFDLQDLSNEGCI